LKRRIKRWLGFSKLEVRQTAHRLQFEKLVARVEELEKQLAARTAAPAPPAPVEEPKEPRPKTPMRFSQFKSLLES
jgi:hypothetical protein